jgi:hypothetical protein
VKTQDVAASSSPNLLIAAVGDDLDILGFLHLTESRILGLRQLPVVCLFDAVVCSVGRTSV